MARPQQISTETITQALAAHPEVTVAEAVETLGIGQLTAAKHLATLEVRGAARREPGGREGGRRVADRWSATEPGPMRRRTTVLIARPTGSPVVSWARSYVRTRPRSRARTSDPPKPRIIGADATFRRLAVVG